MHNAMHMFVNMNKAHSNRPRSHLLHSPSHRIEWKIPRVIHGRWRRARMHWIFASVKRQTPLPHAFRFCFP